MNSKKKFTAVEKTLIRQIKEISLINKQINRSNNLLKKRNTLTKNFKRYCKKNRLSRYYISFQKYLDNYIDFYFYIKDDKLHFNIIFMYKTNTLKYSILIYTLNIRYDTKIQKYTITYNNFLLKTIQKKIYNLDRLNNYIVNFIKHFHININKDLRANK